MSDRDGFAADVAAAALRALAREYRRINWSHFGTHLRPVPLALSENGGRLGCYTRDPRRIELSRALVLEQPWGTVVEVLKHEMAHQFVDEVLGHQDEPAHGPAFQRTCDRLGIDPRASGLPDAEPAAAPILDRVRKLLALASSPNQHEAETAMRTAHRLMLKHNLQHMGSEELTGHYGFRHLGQPTGRVSEAERVLAGLLGEFFFVHPIWVSVFRVADQKRAKVLEITGRHENLAMAEYVYSFLRHAAESLWREHKRKHDITRNADRRAFVAGVMRGFADKLRSERKAGESVGLLWVGDPLSDRYFKQRHPRVRTIHARVTAGSLAGSQGRNAGRSLVLNRPLEAGPSDHRRALPPQSL